MSEEVKGRSSSTAKAVSRGGHQSSGGKAGHGVPARQVRSNNSSALSRANRSRWDWYEGYSGDTMTYQYQEYPKHIYPDPDDTKNYVIVNNADEEQLALGGEEIINEEDERVRLLAVAQVKGVQVDKRWGPAKLTKAIEQAGFDPTLDPFE